jgi:hypothetical protein
MADYIDARQAAERLGVSRQTLYAYVSRGLIKALPGDDPRQSRYPRRRRRTACRNKAARPQTEGNRQGDARLGHAGARIGIDAD